MTTPPPLQQKLGCPFPGLRPFQEQDAPNYYGRTEETFSLLQRLKAQRFVAVVGPSGSGKSSLVRAGVMSALREGYMAGRRQWHIASFRPANSPLTQLANAISELLPPNSLNRESMLRRLRTEPDAISRIISEYLPDRDGLIFLLADQFEELFDWTRRSETRQSIEDSKTTVDLLLAASASEASSVYVCVTMRAEYLGSCSSHVQLASAVNDGLYLVPAITRSQLREVIIEPVRASGASISDALVDRLLNEASNTRDSLPLLQHALMSLWLNESGTFQIELHDYFDYFRQPGNPNAVESATLMMFIDQTGERTLSQLKTIDARLEHIAELVFRHITEVTPSGEKVRRPSSLNDLSERLAASMADIQSVLEAFTSHGCGLLVLKGDIADPETEVDIAHETVIQNWRRLDRWVAEEGFDNRVIRQFLETASDWERFRGEGRRDKAKQLLYGGTQLYQVKTLLKQRRREIPPAARPFYKRSFARVAIRRWGTIGVLLILVGWVMVLQWRLWKNAQERTVQYERKVEEVDNAKRDFDLRARNITAPPPDALPFPGRPDQTQVGDSAWLKGPPSRAWCYQQHRRKQDRLPFSIHCHSSEQGCRDARSGSAAVTDCTYLPEIPRNIWNPNPRGWMNSWFQYSPTQFPVPFPQLDPGVLKEAERAQ